MGVGEMGVGEMGRIIGETGVGEMGVGEVGVILNVIIIEEERKKRIIEPPHDKSNKMTVHSAKTQISLGIRPVWSESSLYAQG